MTILGIDTSAKTCTAALLREEAVLSHFSQTDGNTHSEILLPAVIRCLDEAGVSVSNVDAVAITSGPGSFTGLRIGISTVKGLCMAEDIPCVSVSTLEALAMNARSYEGYHVCALMDARRGEFYHADFKILEGVPVRIREDGARTGETIFEWIQTKEKLIVLGDGAEKFCSMFSDIASCLAPEEIRLQNGISVALIGMKMAKKGDLISCTKLSPSYLRLPQAEREWLARNQQKSEVKK